MAINIENYKAITAALAGKATLVAVSKTKPVEDILALYQTGQRDFGENYVQELVDKQLQLPKDIRWHFIGHLQSNKVKYIAPFVHLIHGVDSIKLLQEINKQAHKLNKTSDVLLQVHIAQEETKFGFDENELEAVFNPASPALPALKNICIKGLMGMASFTEDKDTVKKEFQQLKSLFDKYSLLPQGTNPSNIQFQFISMGMSGDYAMAVECGSNMVRIGSLLFGAREYQQ